MKKTFKHPALEFHNPVTGEYCEDGSIYYDGVITVDSRYIVCPKCNGHGVHFRNDLDEDYLIDSMIEDGDYDGLDDYMKGDYDQSCDDCDGMRVINDPILPEWASKAISDWYECERQDKMYAAQEIRFGA